MVIQKDIKNNEKPLGKQWTGEKKRKGKEAEGEKDTGAGSLYRLERLGGND